jgi:hypothetical protein
VALKLGDSGVGHLDLKAFIALIAISAAGAIHNLRAAFGIAQVAPRASGTPASPVYLSGCVYTAAGLAALVLAIAEAAAAIRGRARECLRSGRGSVCKAVEAHGWMKAHAHARRLRGDL